MHEPAPLGLTELLRAVARRGFRVSEEQLHRWRKAGIVRRPGSATAAHGRGQAARYPASTVELLLALQPRLQRSRNLRAALWQLFLAGQPVATSKVKTFLATITAANVRRRKEVEEGTGDDDRAAARLAKSLSSPAGERGRTPFQSVMLARAKRAVEFTGTTRLLEIANGLVSVARKVDAALLASLIGDDVGGAVPIDTARFVSTALDPLHLDAAVRDASAADLVDAAREFTSNVVPVVHACIQRFPVLGDAIAQELARDPFWPDPLLFLLWLRYRNAPHSWDILAEVRARVLPTNTRHA